MSAFARIRGAFRVPAVLLCSLVPHSAQAAVEVTTFGPHSFVRTTAAPAAAAASFPGVRGAGLLRLDATGVSAAVVKVNGVVVVGPDSFNQQVQTLTVPLELVPKNQLQVEVRGMPGASLRVTVQQVVDASAAGVIGSAGGSVGVGDAAHRLYGARLDVPSGALGEAVLITLDPAGDAPPFGADGPGYTPVRLSPSGLTFSMPAALTLPYDPEALDPETSVGEDTLSMYTYSEAIDRWLSLGTSTVDLENKRVSAPIDHFSLFSLHDDKTPPCEPEPRDGHFPVVLVHGFQAVGGDGLACGFGDEEGTFGSLRSLVQGDPELSDTAVYMFSYDSGRDIEASGRSLAKVIEKVRRCYAEPPAGVTLVAHSQGGLVARSAIETLARTSKTPPVFKLATLATPHAGTLLAEIPMALAAGVALHAPQLVVAAYGACRSVAQLAACSPFLEGWNCLDGEDGLNGRTRTSPQKLLADSHGYNLFIGDDDAVVIPGSSGLGNASWSPIFEPPAFEPGYVLKQTISGGCTASGSGTCGHTGDDGIAHVTSTDHAIWPYLHDIVASGLWRVPADWAIQTRIMPSSKVIERLRITDRPITIDTAALVARGYHGAVQQGEFAVYRRPVAEVTEIPYGRYDGYYERGDPFPSNLELIYAWKPDGTVYIGTYGPADSSLATLVDGRLRLPVQERLVGGLLESDALRLELKSLIGLGLASGLTVQELDQDYYYPLLGKIDVQLFHRFDAPVWRVASAVYLQSIAGPFIYPQMTLWSPLASWGAGFGSRSFRLTIADPHQSYAVAVANNDNGNYSAVAINGQTVVANDHCCENYWRRTGEEISTVSLTTSTRWSQGAPQFNLAVVASGLSVSEVEQAPAGGLSNNHPPLVSRIERLTWTPQ